MFEEVGLEREVRGVSHRVLQVMFMMSSLSCGKTMRKL